MSQATKVGERIASYQRNAKAHKAKSAKEKAGWVEVELADVALPEKGSIRRGPFGGSLKKEIFVPDGYKVYEQKNAIYSDFERGSYFISESKYRELIGFSVIPGDILVSCAGTLGRIAVAPPNARPGVINQALMRIRPNPDVVQTSYLKRFLESEEIQRQFFGSASGSAIKNVKAISELKSARFLLPPLPEQRRIAAVLDAADAIRRKRRQAIELTEQFLRSTFIDMFGDPVTNPRGWPVRPLGDLARVQSGVTKGKKFNGKETVHVPYMRVANVQDGHLVLDEIKEIEVLPSDAKKFLLRDGDVLLTEGGDYDKLGRGTVWHGEIPKCIHQNHIFSVRPLSDEIQADYLSALIGSAHGKRYFLRSAKQTTGIATINKTQLSEFPTLLPPVKLQQAYAASVVQHAAIMTTQAKQFGLSDNLFKSLVQRAFRGEL